MIFTYIEKFPYQIAQGDAMCLFVYGPSIHTHNPSVDKAPGHLTTSQYRLKAKCSTGRNGSTS